MHPSVARSSRSSLQCSAPSPSPSPSLLHQQQQQQQLLYGPMSTLQPCTAPLHPSCVYTATQRTTEPPSPAPLQAQVARSGKSGKWHSKSKQPPRGQYHHSRPAQQQQSYPAKPVVLFDQTQSNPPPSTSSFLVASSTFAHGPFPAEPYNNPGVTLVPQPYFKPPDVQAFCLLHDRQAPQQHSSYYNISATNTCSLQTVNTNSAFQLSSLNPYATATFSNNQISAPLPLQSPQIFQNAAPPIALVFGGGAPRDQQHQLSAVALDVPPVAASAQNTTPAATTGVQMQSVSRAETDWSPPPSRPTALSTPRGVSTARSPRSASSRRNKDVSRARRDERCRDSDDSSVSFDFALEAEKMVSALCNTASSNDLGKEEPCGKPGTAPFTGAGDDTSNKVSWFVECCPEYPVAGSDCGRSVATQTEEARAAAEQCPEMIRKIIHRGCGEAETVLNSPAYRHDPRHGWLSNISCATRTAVMKSSTCFPIFAGDRVFARDLIGAFLRIGNGWLVLDNYLNKQHYPSLTDKLDPELIGCFRRWESSTHELLGKVLRTFAKLNDSGSSQTSEMSRGSFPGDVSLYTNCDIFDPSSHCQSLNGHRSHSESAYAVHYAPQPSGVQNFRFFDGQARITGQKETKPRGKWTITENLASAINGAKSVPDVSAGHTDVISQASRFRAKGSASSGKASSSRQSLNAEFFHLRNQVMEGNSEASRQWILKEKRNDFVFHSKTPSSVDHVFRSKPSNAGYDAAPLSKCLGEPGIFAASNPTVEPIYIGTAPSELNPAYAARSYLEAEYPTKAPKCAEVSYADKRQSDVESVYANKSSADRLELAPVPRTKMTLLSQIEPNTAGKEPEEMTANLSAWFASMRSPNPASRAIANADGRSQNDPRSPHPPEMSRSMMDLTRQLQMDSNRQLQTLRNMQNIQSAPWNVCNLVNGRSGVHQVEEYDSSEDVRVYMKPGSYNVPKKRHQRRSNRRTENSSASRHSGGTGAMSRSVYSGRQKPSASSACAPGPASSQTSAAIKIPFPAAPIVPPPAFSLENSPRILKRVDSREVQQQDVTWKAACASAEILLEALNVRDLKSCAELQSVPENDAETSHHSVRKDAPKSTCENDGASSYEASEDDSGSTCQLSPDDDGHARQEKSATGRTNVKTDSWLIRTLNNASIKQRQEPDLESSESANSSTREGELTAVEETFDVVTTATTACDSKSRDDIERVSIDRTEGIIRATYSETVRRSVAGNRESCGGSRQNQSSASGSIDVTVAVRTVVPTPGRKCPRKDVDRTYPTHKSRKCSRKRTSREQADDAQNEEGLIGVKMLEDATRSPAVKSSQGKRKEFAAGGFVDGKNKASDRGWSVWYSSRRRQGLTPSALSKLETIHQTIWITDEAQIFKYPPSSAESGHATTGTTEDYYKVVKNPVFLETIGYKLKNKIYHKVEHVVRDFRRIVYNSRLYHKNDSESTAKIESFSRKLEELFEEHFANWDFENITGSPRNDNGSPIPPPRYKLAGQKLSRVGNGKKASFVANANAENTTTH